ncbi:MAG: tetratricopeptide repeat protein [Chloroflexi bacterium]|nr:MAG: tetratricopeptide repeat protein [Chloroflexota bacterium]
MRKAYPAEVAPAGRRRGWTDRATIQVMDPEMEREPTDGEAPGHESVYSLLQRGHELMRSRHHAQAAVVLERAARAEPGKGSILEALGRAFYNSGQHGRSRETFEALLEIDPSAHYAHYALGQSLKQLRRTREARTHLKLAVALSPGSALYRAALDRVGDPAKPRKPDVPSD